MFTGQTNSTEIIRSGHREIIMARGDEFRKAYGGLLEAKSMQDYREAYSENSRIKRLMDNYKAKMTMISKYANYTAKYPKHLVSKRDGKFWIDFGDGTEEKEIQKKAYDQYVEENAEIDRNAQAFTEGISGFNSLYPKSGTKAPANTKIKIKENSDGELTLNGKTVDEITTETESKVTTEVEKEEKKLTAHPNLKPNVTKQPFTLDMKDRINVPGMENYVKIKGTDDYYDLEEGNRVSGNDVMEIIRQTDVPRSAMAMEDARAELDRIDQKGKTLPGIPSMNKLGMRVNQEGAIEGTDEVTPFGFAKRLQMAKTANQFKRSFDPNTGKFSLIDPNMGISMTPNTSGGMTVGSMTGTPTGLQDISDGAMTTNFTTGMKPTPEMEAGVDRLVEHRRKFGDPFEKTGYYAKGVDPLTGASPEDRIASRKMIDAKKLALQGYVSNLFRDAKTVNEYFKQRLPDLPEDGYANPYFPK